MFSILYYLYIFLQYNTVHQTTGQGNEIRKKKLWQNNLSNENKHLYDNFQKNTTDLFLWRTLLIFKDRKYVIEC